MHKIFSTPGLPPSVYCEPEILELERQHLFRTHWQWVGLVDHLKDANGIQAEIGGLPITVTGEFSHLIVSMVRGRQRQKLDDAVADICGRFVYVRLAPNGLSLKDYLGDYADLLQHCSDHFDEVYQSETVEWNCNWKAGLEVALEGYHVPVVHSGENGSNLMDALPAGLPPTYVGPHSYQCGLMSESMLEQMANIAKRLKISPSSLYTNYDHFTIFPNMTVGISGGDLCFLQIYNPIDAERCRVTYIYILAKLSDPNKPPAAPLKTTLLNVWRDYTHIVLEEDRRACELFQRGVPWSRNRALLGARAEERVIHFQKHWKQILYDKIVDQVPNFEKKMSAADCARAP